MNGGYEEAARKGRPTRLGAATSEEICQALRAGAMPEQAAMCAGISRSTYYGWLNRGRSARERSDLGQPVEPSDLVYLDFLDAVERAIAAAEVSALSVIDSAAQRGGWRAAAWLLERRFPERWAPASSPASEVLAPTYPTPTSPSLEELERKVMIILDGRSRGAISS